jgi:tripartite-type tricarboxylate transporter receptor subunit TctC
MAVGAAGDELWPARPIRMLISTPAGGSPDFIGRIVAEKLSERLGQPVVVENSASTGLPAWVALSHSRPDGYLIGMLTGGFATRAASAKGLPFDPIKDFTFVTFVSAYPMAVLVASDSPIKDFAGLIAAARSAPGGLTYAMNLPGSVHHLLGEWINIEAGTGMRGIPYRGSAQMLTDILGGRVDVMIDTGTSALPNIASGKVRGLALSSPQRFALAPDVPTIAETLPGVEVMSWLGLAMAPATPAPIVDRLNREVRAILDLPDVRAKFAVVGNVPMPTSPTEMRDQIAREIARWNRVIDAKHIERY